MSGQLSESRFERHVIEQIAEITAQRGDWKTWKSMCQIDKSFNEFCKSPAGKDMEKRMMDIVVDKVVETGDLDTHMALKDENVVRTEDGGLRDSNWAYRVAYRENQKARRWDVMNPLDDRDEILQLFRRGLVKVATRGPGFESEIFRPFPQITRDTLVYYSDVSQQVILRQMKEHISDFGGGLRYVFNVTVKEVWLLKMGNDFILHRTHGPAFYDKDTNTKEWYTYGDKVEEKKPEEKKRPQLANLGEKRYKGGEWDDEDNNEGTRENPIVL